MSNCKNQLQEYCQKNDIPLPIYITNSHGPAHALSWKVKIICNEITLDLPNEYRTKKEAEQAAAEQMYARITNDALPPTQLSRYMRDPDIISLEEPLYRSIATIDDILRANPIGDYNDSAASIPSTEYHVLIDLENIQPAITKTRANCSFHYFLSSFSPIDTTKFMKHGSVHVVDSGVTDAADHLMTYTAAKIMMRTIAPATFIIVSRDKTSDVLAQLIERDGFKVVHFKNAKAFEEFLTTM